ncbi:MAG: hypothetical protein ACRYFS_24610 [Janthinobacterium lividum]
MPLTLENEKIRAIARPITGKYPALAKEVRRLMGYGGDRNFLTGRKLSVLCGASYTAVNNLTRGDRVEEGTLIKIANGLKTDPSHLLTLAGYPASEYTRGGIVDKWGLDGDDPLAAEMLGIYHDMTPSRRSMLVSIARAVKATPEE